MRLHAVDEEVGESFCNRFLMSSSRFPLDHRAVRLNAVDEEVGESCWDSFLVSVTRLP